MRVVQTNISVSSRGAVRGIHFADVPPSQAKYVSDLESVVSAKDGAAPSLDEAAAQGLLPNYGECLAFAESLRRACGSWFREVAEPPKLDSHAR